MAGPTPRPDGEDPTGDDLDARWAELTERLGELRLPPEDEMPPPPAAQPASSVLPPTPGPRDYSPASPAGAEDDSGDPGDVVDDFVAPEPEPLRDAQPILVLGWAAVLLGLGVMVLCVLAWRGAPGVVWLSAAGSLAVGVGILLWRLPARRDYDDDGAVL